MEPESSSIDRNVNDLEAEGRQWLEQLLGRPLSDGQHVYIMTYTPDVEPDENTRQKAAAEIERITTEAGEDAKARGVTAEEYDAAVDEAMDHVRHRKA